MNERDARAAKMTVEPTAKRGHRTVNGHKAISLCAFAGTAERDVPAQHPWPSETFLQGGERGVVFVKSGENYETAFVEAHSGTLGFLRGEGATWQEAEDDAWAKAQRIIACPGPNGHEWEPRGYRNGCGFCKHCGRFASKVFTLEEVGSFCEVCRTPTFWHVEEDGTLRCPDHTPHREPDFLCGCPDCHRSQGGPHVDPEITRSWRSA